MSIAPMDPVPWKKRRGRTTGETEEHSGFPCAMGYGLCVLAPARLDFVVTVRLMRALVSCTIAGVITNPQEHGQRRCFLPAQAWFRIDWHGLHDLPDGADVSAAKGLFADQTSFSSVLISGDRPPSCPIVSGQWYPNWSNGPVDAECGTHPLHGHAAET
ncbi:hypothetical protein [Bradyrhizobium sp. ORS 111]|uniref:hypothetical protein n=1 Tax=Bradyrhizobium sp. ORS 111 TaxID=1685958 RepID=UPI00388F486A